MACCWDAVYCGAAGGAEVVCSGAGDEVFIWPAGCWAFPCAEAPALSLLLPPPLLATAMTMISTNAPTIPRMMFRVRCDFRGGLGGRPVGCRHWPPGGCCACRHAGIVRCHCYPLLCTRSHVPCSARDRVRLNVTVVI